jgi:hypothetical protein
LGEPTALAKIDRLVERYKAAFPESLVKLWRATDGVALGPFNAHIPGPSEITGFLDGPWGGELVERGFVPVLDDHESNYLGVIVRPPLAFRVAHLPHDDASRLVYRDFIGFLTALIEAFDAGESVDCFVHDAQGDYAPDAPRPQTDQDTARALMATDGTSGEWNYAGQLLDASNLAEWARLLETEHFVRRNIVARMRQMRAPAIRELLNRDRLAFDAFARAVADTARSAGLTVGEQRQDVLQVGGHWMNLEGFFHRRNIPDAMPRMIAWFQDLIAGRNPHDRPGHFMADRA